MLDLDTSLSKTRSLHNSTQLGATYISPVQRQQNLTTTMRRDKSMQVRVLGRLLVISVTLGSRLG